MLIAPKRFDFSLRKAIPLYLLFPYADAYAVNFLQGIETIIDHFDGQTDDWPISSSGAHSQLGQAARLFRANCL